MVQLTPVIDVGLPQQIPPEEEELILEGYVSVRGDVQLKKYRRRASDQAGVTHIDPATVKVRISSAKD